MASVTDTIVAPITAPGPAAVAMVRLSGSEAWSIAAQVFTPWQPKPYHARYGRLSTGEDGLALPFAQGHSYTGEESVELSIHGSRAGMQALLEACLAAGARMAEPGEFTLRAFLNGRIDLSRAEAVRDTVEAETDLQFRSANVRREGGLSEEVQTLSNRLAGLVATVEAHVDFSEEIGELDIHMFAAELADITSELARLYEAGRIGRILREGYRVAIIGPPNAGKSSLLNALLGVQRAIVTPIAGTTRDTIEETLDFDGLKVVLTDTAGLRDSDDSVEQIGIERALLAAAEADCVWLIYDSVQGWSADLESMREKHAHNAMVLANKVDLLSSAVPPGHLGISCLSGSGLTDLAGLTKVRAIGDADLKRPMPMARHLPYLAAALQALEDARTTVANDRPSDLLSVCLGQAIHDLGGITGETVGADILDRIFHDFCIGK